MLFLLLFNMGGYLLFFQFLIYRSDTSIIENINANRYKSSDLVEVKIPVHLTITDWHDYAVISGQVKFKEHIYDYAELKMTRDTMYLKCIANHEKGRLVNAIYGKQVNDIPIGKKAALPSLKKIFSENQYICVNNKLPAFTIATVISNWRNYAFAKLSNTTINFAGQPPDASNPLS